VLSYEIIPFADTHTHIRYRFPILDFNIDTPPTPQNLLTAFSLMWNVSHQQKLFFNMLLILVAEHVLCITKSPVYTPRFLSLQFRTQSPFIIAVSLWL
jgi:hypothetical protein